MKMMLNIFFVVIVGLFVYVELTTACFRGDFRCKKSSKCISTVNVCDSKPDCGYRDFTDELNCGTCSYDQFQCFKSKNCISQAYVCDGDRDCGSFDASDEEYCNPSSPKSFNPLASRFPTTVKPVTCNKEAYFCRYTNQCMSPTQMCDGKVTCHNSIDERNCSVTKVADVAAEKLQCIKWFMDRRQENSVHKWGLQLHRTAVALYLADENFFSVNNSTGQEIRYELTIRMLSKIKSRKILKTQQLALYVHALLVSCINPRHFHGHDLVSDLRRRVNFSKYTSPLAILALCNAGAPMTRQDVMRLQGIYASRHTAYWTEVQVLATMALSCINSKTNLGDQELYQWIAFATHIQLHDTDETNPRTVALIIQMMLGSKYTSGFNWTAAVEVIKHRSFMFSSNFLDKYYLTPILNNKGLNAINDKHCDSFYDNDLLLNSKKKMIVVKYTVWAKEGTSLGKSWRIQVPFSSSLYDVILKVQTLDATHRVTFNKVEGKPFVRSVSGVDEDPETDDFWFTYKRTFSQEPQLLEDSPVDIIVDENDEFILWYRNGIWNNDGSGGSGDIP